MPRIEPLRRQTTAEVIAERIRQAIVSGDFAPGQQLGEAELAEQLQLSRGPVREALQRLIQEGLLHNEWHRGVFVVELDADDVEDIYLARGAIEQAAARIVTEKGDPALFEDLEAILEQMREEVEADRWVNVADRDVAFHETVVAGSGSKRLAKMYGTLISETRICLTPLGAYPRKKGVVETHRTLMEAMRSGDLERVSELVRSHFDDAVVLLRESFPAPPTEG